MILDAIDAGAQTLDDIAGAAGGAYPSSLQGLLAELVSEGLINQIGDRYTPKIVRPAGPEPSTISLPRLPLPHPGDSDWRFHDSTARHLARTIIQEARRGGSVVLIGAPRLFAELAALSELGEIYLLDSNEELIRRVNAEPLPSRFHAVYHDLTQFGPLPIPQKAGVVFCDPPWYPEYYDAFLAHASLSVQLGGKVFVSLLPALTRPGAWEDRWQLLASANSLGLHIESLTLRSVRYETPLFEHRSLAREGLSVGDWRAADLLRLRKFADPNSEAIGRIQQSVQAAKGNSVWMDILIEDRKVKLRGPLGAPDEAPALIPIEHNDVLPTVSRRYSGRDRVDLWFWDNRVFGVRGKAALWAALNLVAGRPTRDPHVPDPLLRRAIDLLRPLLDVPA